MKSLATLMLRREQILRELVKIEKRLIAIRRAHGLSDQPRMGGSDQ